MTAGCKIGKVTLKNGLTVHPFPANPPFEQPCVDMLLNSLQFARAGHITSVCVIGYAHDGVVLTDMHVASGDSFMALAGACERMKMRLIEEFNGG